MMISTLTRLAGAGGLALMLTACMDVSMTVDIKSEAEAEATMVTAMKRDMYDLMMAQSTEDDDDFCADGKLVEKPDVMECTVIESGPFAELEFDSDDGESPSIEAIGGGQVRVSFPTGDLAESLAEDTGAAEDIQIQAMIASMFEGHAITMTVTGGPIVDTNMQIAADGMSASYEIPFVDLFGSDLDLPAELYAIVQK